MSGICGVLNLDNNPIKKDLIKNMCLKISHRGPDDKGTFVDKYVGLGHVRLSIIDLSSAGHQPMCNENKTNWIIHNGEIYNFLDIRLELCKRGHHFKSNTDAEVIIHSYEEWNKKCLKKFNGMFAFGIWDAKEKLLFLARDRLGVKPLYYYLDSKKIIFSSEIKAILVDPTASNEIDMKGLINYFSYGHSVASNTIYKNIKKLLPGHYLICKDGKVSIHQYWDMPFIKEKENKGEKYYCERLFELLIDSVKKRLVSDVFPLGVFLSGGIDSSIIVAIMNKINNQSIKTFSVGFDIKGSNYNELSDANLVAKYFNTDHHEILLTDSDLIDALQKLVYHYDEPFGDVAAFPTYLVSKVAKNYVKVCLTGEGADEIFGGYRRYVAEKYTKYYNLLPCFLKDNLIKKSVNLLPRFRRIKTIINTICINDEVKRHGSWLNIFSDDMKANLFNSYVSDILKNIDSFEIYKKYFPLDNQLSTLDKIMYVDLKTRLPNMYLEKIDKASMAVSLEARVPFLDHRLVEFAATIPAKYKIKNFNTKYILKKTAKSILPKNVINKPKHGFAVPIDPWFSGKLKNFIRDILLDKTTLSREFLNKKYIQEIYNKHLQGKEVYALNLWLILIFELWYREYLK